MEYRGGLNGAAWVSPSGVKSMPCEARGAHLHPQRFSNLRATSSLSLLLLLCRLNQVPTMVQPKQGLSLLKFIPKAMRPQTTDISSAALWGTTAVCGALWLVQPFDWIKAQFTAAPEEESK